MRDLVLKGKTAAAKTEPPAAAAEGASAGPMEKRAVDPGAVKEGQSKRQMLPGLLFIKILSRKVDCDVC